MSRTMSLLLLLLLSTSSVYAQNEQMSPLLQDCYERYHTAPDATALAACNQAIETARSKSDASAEAQALIATAAIYDEMGDRKLAIQRLETALKIEESLGHKAAEAQVHSALGEIYYKLGDKQKSEEHYKQALATARKSGDKNVEEQVVREMNLAQENGGKTLKALEDLKRGITAYHKGKLTEAASHFESSIGNDPTLVAARLWLGTVYAQMFDPEAETPTHPELGVRAEKEFAAVLVSEPANINALRGIASVQYRMGKYQEAGAHYTRCIDLEPKNAENYYSAATMHWAQANELRMAVRQQLGVAPDALLSDANACEQLRTANEARVRDGISLLEKALALKPDYKDAMGYMSALYEERADYECNDEAARAADLTSAREWATKTTANLPKQTGGRNK